MITINEDAIQELFSLEPEEIDMEDTKDAKNWLISGNDIYPETTMEVKDSLDSGLYDIKYNRGNGKIFFVKKEIETDEMIMVNKELENIVKSVSEFTAQGDLYKNAKLTHKRSYIFCGPPGCGKTSHINILVEKLSNECNCIALNIDGENFWMMRQSIEAIRVIENKRLIVVVIEDTDELLNDRDESPLTNLLDGSIQYDNIIYLMTTNSIDKFPPRMLRPSRIDEIYEIMLPNEESIKLFLSKKIDDEKLINELTDLALKEKFNMSEVKELFIGTHIQKLDKNVVVNRIKDIHSFIKEDKRTKSGKKQANKNINNF